MKAIDKMVRFLEIFDQDVICAGGNSRGGFAEIMAEALRLAAEEKAGDEGLREAEQKPTAPAGLVEELRALQKEIYALKIKERDGLANPETELNDRYHLGLSAGLGIASDRLKEVIASYRPAEAKADEGLREALEAVCQTHLYKMDNSFRQGAQAMYDSFAKRRPTPDRTEELVKRLREWQARPDRDDIRAWIEFNEILADFEKGAM